MIGRKCRRCSTIIRHAPFATESPLADPEQETPNRPRAATGTTSATHPGATEGGGAVVSSSTPTSQTILSQAQETDRLCKRRDELMATMGKGDLSLLPGAPLNLVALAAGSGLSKYPRDDWRRKDLDLREYASKSMRHTLEWLEGKTGDEESGVSPLAHAAFDLLIILWHEGNGSGSNKPFRGEVSNDG